MQNNRYVLKIISKTIGVILIAIFLFFVGMMIGYGTIGEGDAKEVFNPRIWSHIIDLFR